MEVIENPTVYFIIRNSKKFAINATAVQFKIKLTILSRSEIPNPISIIIIENKFITTSHLKKQKDIHLHGNNEAIVLKQYILFHCFHVEVCLPAFINKMLLRIRFQN